MKSNNESGHSKWAQLAHGRGRPLAWLVVIATSFVLYNNCSPVNFASSPKLDGPGAAGSPDGSDVPGGGGGPGNGSGNGNGGNGNDDGDGPKLPPPVVIQPPPPAVVEEVRKACEGGNYIEKVVSVSFPDPVDPNDRTQTCKWEQNGNRAMSNGFFTARVEQNVDFDLPVGSKICAMDFEFTPQQMIYDDHIFLAFDDSILAASYPVDDRLPIVDKVMVYDWKYLVGTGWPLGNFSYIYCLGRDEGASSCTWPQTETVGTIAMSYQPSVLQRITARNIGRTNHQFKWITTGDNDPRTDCQHSPISFSVKVKYAF